MMLIIVRNIPNYKEKHLIKVSLRFNLVLISVFFEGIMNLLKATAKIRMSCNVLFDFKFNNNS